MSRMIRKAQNTKQEIQAIFQLITEAALLHKILPRTIEEITNTIDSFYVAERDGLIIGCCALEIYNPKLAEIRSLSVSLDHQKNGIGRELVTACVEEAKNKGIYEVLAITDKDIFFEKAGFGKCLNGQWAMFKKLK